MSRPRIPLTTRFFEKVYMALDGHWYWLGAGNANGYGHLWDADAGRQRMAHQISFELHGGTISAGLEVDHKCRIPSCVNPKHLRAVTHRVNVLAGTSPLSRNAEKTHCSRGHLFDEANTLVSTRNGYITRRCRQCAAFRETSYQGICQICNSLFTGRRQTTICGKDCLRVMLSRNGSRPKRPRGTK